MSVRSTAWIGKFLSIIGVVMLVLAGLSACTQNNSNPNQNTSPIKIGYTVPRTGDFSSDGPLLERGYQLWASIVNKNGGLLGRQVQLVGLDDATKPDQVTANYTKLISVDHVDLLFAPFSGDLTVPAAIVAHRFGYVLVEGAATEAATYQHGLDNLFAVSLPAEHYITSFSNFILSLPQQVRPTKAAYVTSNDAFTEPQVTTAKTLLENGGQAGGVQTVLFTTFPPETTSFTPLAERIVLSGAQVVVLGTLDVPSLAAFIKYFRAQHYNPQALIAATGPDQGSTFINAIGGTAMAEGVFVPNDGWYPGIKTYHNDQFEQAYIAKYGGSANDISSDPDQGFASAQVLQQAIAATHSFDQAKLKQYLRTNSFSSIQGTVVFDAAGRNTASVAFLFQWQKGQLIPVFPSYVAQANPEFPKQQWP